jgi:D-alanyl-D-alanine carboxypeptidase (penicillin-binding protein 5/6)
VPKLRFDQYLSILLLCGVILFLPGFNAIQQLDLGFPPKTFAQQIPDLITQVTIPVYSADNNPFDQFLDFTARSLYVMDRESGSILYAKNPDQPRSIASTAKMMTALVALETYPLDRELTVREEAFTTGTTMGLKVGEKMKVSELLKGLLIPSGNDAAFVFANNHPQGYSGFLTAMNAKAKQLHLKDSVFRTPSGLDEEDQSSSAHDLAILANEVMKNPILRSIVGTKQTTIQDSTGKISHILNNTQALLGEVEGVVGIKTGTTEFAGENLVTEVDRDGHQVIIVVLGSKDRFNETRQIIDWVFQNYDWKKIDASAEEIE